MVFDDHLVVVLQVPLADKFLVMNMYKVYNLPLSHPILHKTFQYFIGGEYLTFLSNGDYATPLSDWDMLACVFIKANTW